MKAPLPIRSTNSLKVEQPNSRATCCAPEIAVGVTVSWSGRLRSPYLG